jgi:hypothetical protein
MTGKNWTLIKGSKQADGSFIVNPGAAGIIGVVSKSDDEPYKIDFKDTALENMAPSRVGSALGTVTTVTPISPVTPNPGVATTSTPQNSGAKMTKYSEWEFKAESPVKNDHKKIYRAYHERW